MDTENNHLMQDPPEERRLRRGTWPWFVLNQILFPSPAHFTLLRVREFSLAKSVFHLGITFVLLLILLGAVLLQVMFSEVGRLWMLLPIASGFVVVFANRSLRTQFQPFGVTPAR